MYKVFIVEDEKDIAENISQILKKWNMETYIVQDFNNIVEEFKAYLPQVVLMDISLPFMNGYYWCEKIRKLSNLPIIFISSIKETMSQVMAMNMGADDFIEKPFDSNILVAKIQALLRRSYDYKNDSAMIFYKDTSLNILSGEFFYKDSKIELTKNEFRIILTLYQNVNKIVSRQKLMQVLWQTEEFVDDNTLTVNVNRLRKKLSNVGLDNFIETKFGEGYIIE